MDFTRLSWEELIKYQGNTFYTAKKLPFTYTIKGGEMFVDRRSKSITRATYEKAVEKIRNDKEHQITGPKSLCCFGAPYIWAVIQALEAEDEKRADIGGSRQSGGQHI